MSESHAVRVGSVPVELPPAHRVMSTPVRWGVWGLIVIEAAILATLITSYFYLRLEPIDWAPAHLEPPRLVHASALLPVLLVTAGLARWAAGRASKKDRAGALSGLGAAFLGGVGALGLHTLQLRSLGFGADDHTYGSIVWVMSGSHMAILAGAIAATAALLLLGRSRGWHTGGSRLALHLNRLHWDFVALSWVPVYLVLYWLERLA